MKTQNRLINILLVGMLILVLSACDSKSTKEETNTTQNPTVETTEDTSTDGAVVTGGTTTSVNSGTTTSNGGASSGTGNTTGSGNDNSTGGGANMDGGSDNHSTSGNNNNNANAESHNSGDSGNNSNGNDSNSSNGSGGSFGGEDNNTSTDGNATIGGGDDNSTNSNGGNSGGGDNSSDQNTTNPISKLNLTIDQTTLNKDTNTTLKVEATYKDNTAKPVTNKAEWLITPKDAVKITGNTLTALKDGNVTVQATVGGVNSNTLNLAITWVVNGHVLPPEPDPAVNNATLLGVDVNDNGVRDDVERAIYKKFPKEIRRKQLMQRAKSDQSMMADDEAIKNAQKWQKIIANKNIACAKYLFRKFDIDFNLEADDYMDNIQYNTKDRVFKYMRYNHALGGGVYFTPESIVNESSCEFNVTQALKAQ